MFGIFETERLYFREFTLDDVGFVGELNSDPDVTRYVNDSTTSWQPIDVLQRILIPQYRLHKYGRWAVLLKDNSDFIGWCGLKYRPEHLYVDLGYRYLQRHWGNGYATEAAKGCLYYGLHNLCLPKVVAMAHVENKSSWKVLEKAGMHFTGESLLYNSPVRTYEKLG